jgi:hypothetical protein
MQSNTIKSEEVTVTSDCQGGILSSRQICHGYIQYLITLWHSRDSVVVLHTVPSILIEVHHSVKANNNIALRSWILVVIRALVCIVLTLMMD